MAFVALLVVNAEGLAPGELRASVNQQTLRVYCNSCIDPGDDTLVLLLHGWMGRKVMAQCASYILRIQLEYSAATHKNGSESDLVLVAQLR